ncbi:MAG: thiamine pyrophosphate-dependent enzyme [Candidatus Woesearchaeota archaeon]
MNFKEMAAKPERMTVGHRMCPGCGQATAARLVIKSTDYPVVVANATGCLEVSTSIYPFSAWAVPWIHNAFENAGATISGVETAYRSLKKQGKIPSDKEVKFIAFGGDGGTYDIGLQSLSGAMERGHDFAYFCFDNEGYMNTGIQRSSATPYGADTKTTPAGKVHPGKEEFKKDIAAIAAAHHIPYVAQASVGNIIDLVAKAKKAIETPGPAFVVIMSPCIPGWRTPDNMAIKLSKMATETNFWPLFEIENGVWKLNYEPKERKPITEWMSMQGRFKHLMKEDKKDIVEKIQADVDLKFKELKMKCEMSASLAPKSEEPKKETSEEKPKAKKSSKKK